MEIVEAACFASAMAGHVVGGGETTRDEQPDKPYSPFFYILSKSFIFRVLETFTDEGSDRFRGHSPTRAAR